MEAMPELKFAELIDGVVYMPSPQTSDHGRAEIRIDTWLGMYIASTPGCDAGSQSTWLMLQARRSLTPISGYIRSMAVSRRHKESITSGRQNWLPKYAFPAWLMISAQENAL